MGKHRRDALTTYLVKRLAVYALGLAFTSALLDSLLELLMRDLPMDAPVPWYLFGFLLLDIGMVVGFVVLFARVIRRRVREENERAAKERTRMMADLGHDLRSPLTSVKGYARAVADGRLTDPDAIRQAAGTIYRRAADMEALIGQMLDYARAEGKGEAENRWLPSLAAIIREAVAEHYPRFEEKHMLLECELSADTNLKANPVRIRRAFENILLNTLVHCGEHTRVKVETRLHKEKGKSILKLQVMDSGPDIPKDQRERIFDSFVKLDDSRGQSGGHGLGLSIARELVEEAGGGLSLEDAQKPFTKAFVVSLPVERAPQAPVLL